MASGISKLWLLLLVGTISLYVIRQANDGPYGKDFTMFLTGAHMLSDGQGASLYDLGAQATAQATIKGPFIYPGGVLPFNYPPYVAAFLSPLAFFEPGAAYYVWLVVQFLLLLILAISIRRQRQESAAPILIMLAPFAALFVSVYLLVFRIVPSYTPLIIAMLLCGGAMLTLLVRAARSERKSAPAPVDVTGATGWQ